MVVHWSQDGKIQRAHLSSLQLSERVGPKPTADNQRKGLNLLWCPQTQCGLRSPRDSSDQIEVYQEGKKSQEGQVFRMGKGALLVFFSTAALQGLVDQSLRDQSCRPEM